MTHLRAWDTLGGGRDAALRLAPATAACRPAGDTCHQPAPSVTVSLPFSGHLSARTPVSVEGSPWRRPRRGQASVGTQRPWLSVSEKPKPLFLTRSQPSGKPVGHWRLGVCDLRDDLHSPCPGLRQDRHRQHHGQGRTRGSGAPRSSFHHCQGGPQSPLRLHVAHSQWLTDRGGCSVPTGLRGLRRKSHAVLRDPTRGEAAPAPPCTPQQPALSCTAGGGGG